MFLGFFHCLPLQAVLEMEAQRRTSPKSPMAILQVLLGAGEAPASVLPLCPTDPTPTTPACALA